MLLALFVLLAAAEDDRVPDAPPHPDPVHADPTPISPPPSPARVHLVYTGGSQGIGSGHYTLRLHEYLRQSHDDAPAPLVSIEAHHGTLASNGALLSTDDRRFASALGFLGDGQVTCEAPVQVTGLSTPTELMVIPGDPPGPWFDDLVAQYGDRVVLWRRRCTNADGAGAWLTATEPELPPSWDLPAWEVRLALHAVVRDGEASRDVEVVGRPDREPARRFATLVALRRAQPEAMYLDAGAFIDGTSSVTDGAPSLHRPLGLQMLQRLSPTALVPAETELAGGARAFFAEIADLELPYVATNWSTTDPTLALPDTLQVTVEAPEQAVRIAFLGVIDPVIADWVPELAREGVTLTEPVDAVRDAVARLRRSDLPPDSIVVLTTAHPSLLGRLRAEVVGVDLVVGDTLGTTRRIQATDTLLRNDRDVEAALTLPLDGIGTAELTFARPDANWSLARVTTVPHQVEDATEPDPEVRAAVTGTRAAVYPPLDRPLLPPPPGDPTATLSSAQWSRIVCEAVAARTHADVVLLPELPDATPVPGPLTELLVLDRLALRDRLEVHFVPGDRLPALLLQLYGLVRTSCAAPLGDKKPKTGGWPIEADQVYRVVTTDRARATTPIGPLLEASYSSFKLDPRMHALEDEDGRPLSLRWAVLDELRTLRDRGDDVVAVLTARSPGTKVPRTVLRVRRFALAVERFQGADRPEYAEVPETLATSPSSLTILSDLDVALEYGSRTLLWDLRARAGYARLVTQGADPRETADDLRPSTSVSTPGLKIPAGPLSFMPYGELLLDSELTPTDDLPRQADLSLTVGLQAGALGALKRLRVGGLVARDLAVLGKSTELGGRLELETLRAFGPGLKWTTVFDGWLYANTKEQDASDLRFKATLQTRVAAPLTRWLASSVYGQAFLFRGRTVAAHTVGVSWTLGFSLDVAGAFRL